MPTVTSRKTASMPKLNPLNERIKRDYARRLKGAQGKSAATVDAALKAIARFEEYTGPATSRRFGASRPSHSRTASRRQRAPAVASS